MAGRTPAAAVQAFLKPIQVAVGCVSRAKVVSTRTGGFLVDEVYSWNINNTAGAQLQGGLRDALLFGQMQWMVVEDKREGLGPYRVTTLAYDYSLEGPQGHELWAMHWQPNSRVSLEKRPHLHLGPAIRQATGLGETHHLTTGRMTFESAVQWAVNFGAKPLRDDWSERLAEGETAHLLHRSWNADPTLRAD